MKPKNEAGDLMAIHLAELGYEFIREYQFHHSRLWRFDFLLAESSVAVEIRGESGARAGTCAAPDSLRIWKNITRRPCRAIEC